MVAVPALALESGMVVEGALVKATGTVRCGSASGLMPGPVRTTAISDQEGAVGATIASLGEPAGTALAQ
eukprot:4017780-Alexandrium_andersonii.AAC.1